MPETLHLDFETRSVVDLRACGVYRYAEDPSTRVLCMAYAFGYGKVEGWQQGQPFPQEVIDHVRGGGLVAAHNAVFERMLWNEALARQVPGLPILISHNMDCTMARAYAMGLPGSLDDAAKAMKLDYRKDPAGYAIMLKMCKPRGYAKDGSPYWWDEPEMHAKLLAYCKADVLVEQELDARLPKLTPQERKIWLLDQSINDKGVALALDIIPRASEVGEVAKKWAGSMLRGLTGGVVHTVNQSAATISWLQGRGFDCDSMAKQEIEGLLLQAVQREDAIAETAIRLKSEYAKSSIDKLDAMLRCANKDARARGLLAYYATHTGRWAGRLIQPQNLARVDWDVDGELIVVARHMLATAKNASDAADSLKLLDSNVVTVLAKTIRSMFIAGDGKRLFGGDFSNIEGRLNAWVSGENWKIKAFEDYDAGTGPDLYKLAYSRGFQKEVNTVSKSDRQIGKVMELSCIAEGELVLTDAGLVPIERVELRHKVWDGVDFVPHEGVVYRGIKEILTYDGLIATADHEVWIEGAARPVAFGDAAASGKRLLRSAAGGEAVRVGSGYISREALSTQMERLLRGGSLQGLRGGEMGVSVEFKDRALERLPAVFTAEDSSEVVGEKGIGYARSLHKPESQRLAQLWRAWNLFRVLFGPRRGLLDSGEPGAASRAGAGSDRQQPWVQTGELALRNEAAKLPEPASFQEHRRRAYVGKDEESFQLFNDAEVHGEGLSQGSRCRAGVQSGGRQEEELEAHKEQAPRARVFDILNAGPRNRFTVSGVLVHNCGYQGGVGAFQNMAALYGVKVSDEDAQTFKKAWREANPHIVSSWWAYNDAAIAAVASPGEKFEILGGKVAYIAHKGFLFCRLPSGRIISYPYPRLVKTDTPVGERWAVEYYGQDSKTKQWGMQRLYGGLLCNNVVQGSARDVLVEAMFNAEAAGFPLVLTVHDELISEAARGEADEAIFKAALESKPLWAGGLPLTASTWNGLIYGK